MGSRKDEDGLARVIVWERVDGALDGTNVRLLMGSRDEDSPLDSREGGSLALGIGINDSHGDEAWPQSIPTLLTSTLPCV